MPPRWSVLTCAIPFSRAGSSLASSSQGSPRRQSWASGVIDIDPPPSPTECCDARLQLLEISNWTSAPVSNALAATLISLYLKVDHPTLGLFDDDLFLADLIRNRPRYCSRLLVSSILVWACVSSPGRIAAHPPSAHNASSPR